MNGVRSVVLPLFAVILSFSAITYSACNNSVAVVNNAGPAAELKQEINHFEMALEEIKKIHAEHVKTYSNEMGCNGQSQALDLISKHNDIITHYQDRLDYYKLQLIQADTTNSVRNKTQLEEVKKDITSLQNDSKEIKDGFNDIAPSHVTR